MKKVLAASIISSMIMFSGCGETGDDNNTTVANDGNLDILDADKPRIVLEKNPQTGSTDVEIKLGENVTEYGYSANDEVDGDLSYQVKRTNDIDFTRAGTYTITYFIEDSDGYTDTKTRRVTIVDNNNYNGSGENSYGLLEDYNTGSGSDGYSWNEGTGSSIDSFKSWYSSVCGQTFNASLYNATTGQYSAEISCSNRNLQTIDLRELSIFSTIQGLDLSNNQLTDIDFSQLGLNELSNNTKILRSLNLKNNTLSTDNFNLFRPLHYLKDIDNLYIKGNNFNYTCDDLYTLRTDKQLFNNGSLKIDREIELNCPSIQK